ncbi:amino acid ABC transporter permease [Actinotalea sp. M2MS4P-6]|uniref:amino acid ABC transporter permease n=1 Tax=Actinotalea sp. M2MS4P-6 TaxID=2983762 RepID=UPI0021E42F22|nr:amino acid ABC transporter permease [Actinotalea sp. M2MS4P-6]MCV2393463.1 amino acid ABC transporter permease [Actinotalea sp. M2MS4P-6]
MDIGQYIDDFTSLFSQYDVLAAFRMTIALTLASAVGSLLIGTVVAIMRVSPIDSLRGAGALYVNIVRNTPLTLIIVFCSLGLFYSMGLQLADRESPTFLADQNFRLAVLGLSVYHAAFAAEALRSGINTVPKGQVEAARSIGLGFLQSMRIVVLPQAFRGAIAPLGNTLIALTKNTTVASAIGVAEAAALMKVMIEFRPDVIIAIFLLFALGFVVIVLPTGVLFTWLSRRLAVVR